MFSGNTIFSWCTIYHSIAIYSEIHIEELSLLLWEFTDRYTLSPYSLKNSIIKYIVDSNKFIVPTFQMMFKNIFNNIIPITILDVSELKVENHYSQLS